MNNVILIISLFYIISTLNCEIFARQSSPFLKIISPPEKYFWSISYINVRQINIFVNLIREKNFSREIIFYDPPLQK